MAEEKKYLGVAAVERLIANTREEINAGDEATLASAKAHAESYADSLADNYDAAGTAATKMQELADGQVKTNTEAISAINNGDTGLLKQAKDYSDEKDAVVQGAVDKNTAAIGTMDDLETTAKTDLVKAINEVRNAVSVGGTAAAVTMEEKTSDLGEGVAKAYVLKQGENTVGTINIPKDMVVQSGEVVVDPEGQASGTYIKLVLANATNDIIYVNVGTLVDIYKAKANAAQIQLTIDSATREISASIVAGSVTDVELAANAVVTTKIADGNVTKAKLSTDVQASLDKADNAEANAKSYADGLNSAMDTRVKANEEALADGGSVDIKIANAKDAAISTAAGDATSKANKALDDAKAYADSKVDGIDLSGIATNAADIDKLEESLAEGGATANAIADAKKAGTDAQGAVESLTNGEVADLRADVDNLKAVTYVEITADEIDAMFNAE